MSATGTFTTWQGTLSKAALGSGTDITDRLRLQQQSQRGQRVIRSTCYRMVVAPRSLAPPTGQGQPLRRPSALRQGFARAAGGRLPAPVPGHWPARTAARRSGPNADGPGRWPRLLASPGPTAAAALQ